MAEEAARTALLELLRSRGVQECFPTPSELDRLIATGFDTGQALEAVSSFPNALDLLSGPPMSLRLGPAAVIIVRFGPGARKQTKRACPEDEVPVSPARGLPQHLSLYSMMVKTYSNMMQAYLDGGRQDQSQELSEPLLGTREEGRQRHAEGGRAGGRVRGMTPGEKLEGLRSFVRERGLELPSGCGWKCMFKRRRDSHLNDCYYFSPTGEKYRSMGEVVRFLQAGGVALAP